MLTNLHDSMEKSLQAFQKKLNTINTGRASISMLDNIVVECYSNRLSLAQVATLTVSSATTLVISVWDSNNTKAVEKALLKSDLGITPKIEGNTLFLQIPQLTTERRQELVKLVYKYAEESKVSIRNLRRIEMDNIKESKKDSSISEDEFIQLSKDIQQCTNKFIDQVEQIAKKKEQAILKI